MLHECFWHALARDPKALIASSRFLLSGRAKYKQALVRHARVDVGQLPYNTEVIDYVIAWRKHGGRTMLVTATDQSIADEIAAHLGIFDEALGSNGNTNLKGAAKGAHLAGRFGEKGFAYIGDSRSDVAVWSKAARIVTVNASPSLRRHAEALNALSEHIVSGERSLRPYIEALRPHQWLKNLLVFVPMLGQHNFAAETILQSFLAFIAFCMVASGGYLVNDLLDLSADRVHLRKRERPLASGALSILHGSLLAPALCTLGFTIAFSVNSSLPAVIFVYFLLSMSYSLYLKRRMIIDIFMLTGLYTLRIFAGSVATDISLSVWLLAFSFFLFLALASVKRQAELVDGVRNGKSELRGRGYQTSDLPIVTQFAVSSGLVAVLVLALYLTSATVLQLYSTPEALWGICLVLTYWMLRTVMVAHRGDLHDDPLIFAVKDRVSLACGLLIGGFALVAIFL